MSWERCPPNFLGSGCVSWNHRAIAARRRCQVAGGLRWDKSLANNTVVEKPRQLAGQVPSEALYSFVLLNEYIFEWILPLGWLVFVWKFCNASLHIPQSGNATMQNYVTNWNNNMFSILFSISTSIQSWQISLVLRRCRSLDVWSLRVSLLFSRRQVGLSRIWCGFFYEISRRKRRKQVQWLGGGNSNIFCILTPKIGDMIQFD